MHQRKKSANHPDHGQRRLSKEHKCKVSPSAATINWSRPGSREYCQALRGLLFPLNPAARAGFRGGDFMNSSAPPEWYFFLREKEYPKDLLRDRKRRGGLCNAGNGHRDFDSLGQSQEKHRNHETCLYPPAMCIADRAMLGFVDARSSLTHPFPFPRGRGSGDGVRANTVCVDLADPCLIDYHEPKHCAIAMLHFGCCRWSIKHGPRDRRKRCWPELHPLTPSP